MAWARQGDAPRQVASLLGAGTAGGRSDGELLEEFRDRAAEGAEWAFTVLVERHGSMVLRVCRAILRDENDARDAFQATFLVLVQQARSIRSRDSIAGWLHEVARRTALNVRSATIRRRAHERQAAERAAHATIPAPADDLGAVVHAELARLAERQRAVVVLCDLEGLTEGQAARQLGWPLGTVRSRLARGRVQLRERLTQRGLAPGAAVWFGPLGPGGGRFAVPPSLGAATVRAALVSGGRTVTETVAANIVTISRAVQRSLLMNQVQMIAANFILWGAAFTGIGLAWTTTGGLAAQEPAQQAQSEGPRTPPPPPGVASEAQSEVRTKSDREQIQGVWILANLEQVGSQPTDEERAAWTAGAVTITITADKLTFDGDKSSMYYRLDATKTPKLLLLEVPDGPDKGKVVPAIYRLEGDDLTYCQGRLGDTQPPRDLSTKNPRPGTSPTLWVLHRKRDRADPTRGPKDGNGRGQSPRGQSRSELDQASPAPEAVRPPAQGKLAPAQLREAEAEVARQLRGTWERVHFTYDDKEYPPKLEYDRLVFDGEHHVEFRTRPREAVDGQRDENVGRCTCYINPDKSPKEITIFNEGVLFQMIYELAGDELKVAFFGRSEIDRPRGWSKDPNGLPLIVKTYRRAGR